MSRILVIDDDKFVRVSIGAVLRAAGHEVVEAGDADAGIALYRGYPSDVVLVDIVMPNKEGLETIRELVRDFPGIRIIAISGAGQIVSKNFALTAKAFGAMAALEKPFGGDELLAAVNTVAQTDPVPMPRAGGVNA
ncbi:MAG: response regulator [Alphaproteobacteria bacterium]|nr:response regulator [Alphaproteobacteria bacterium]